MEAMKTATLVNQKSYLLEENWKDLAENKFTDLVFILDDNKRIEAHSLVLGEYSNTIYNILYASYMVPCQKLYITLKGVKIDAMKNFLQLLYTGNVKLLNETEEAELSNVAVLLDIENMVARKWFDVNETRVDNAVPNVVSASNMEKQDVKEISQVIDRGLIPPNILSLKVGNAVQNEVTISDMEIQDVEEVIPAPGNCPLPPNIFPLQIGPNAQHLTHPVNLSLRKEPVQEIKPVSHHSSNGGLFLHDHTYDKLNSKYAQSLNIPPNKMGIYQIGAVNSIHSYKSVKGDVKDTKNGYYTSTPISNNPQMIKTQMMSRGNSKVKKTNKSRGENKFHQFMNKQTQKNPDLMGINFKRSGLDNTSLQYTNRQTQNIQAVNKGTLENKFQQSTNKQTKENQDVKGMNNSKFHQNMNMQSQEFQVRKSVGFNISNLVGELNQNTNKQTHKIQDLNRISFNQENCNITTTASLMNHNGYQITNNSMTNIKDQHKMTLGTEGSHMSAIPYMKPAFQQYAHKAQKNQHLDNINLNKENSDITAKTSINDSNNVLLSEIKYQPILYMKKENSDISAMHIKPSFQQCAKEVQKIPNLSSIFNKGNSDITARDNLIKHNIHSHAEDLTTNIKDQHKMTLGKENSLKSAMRNIEPAFQQCKDEAQKVSDSDVRNVDDLNIDIKDQSKIATRNECSDISAMPTIKPTFQEYTDDVLAGSNAQMSANFDNEDSSTRSSYETESNDSTNDETLEIQNSSTVDSKRDISARPTLENTFDPNADDSQENLKKESSHISARPTLPNFEDAFQKYASRLTSENHVGDKEESEAANSSGFENAFHQYVSSNKDHDDDISDAESDEILDVTPINMDRNSPIGEHGDSQTVDDKEVIEVEGENVKEQDGYIKDLGDTIEDDHEQVNLNTMEDHKDIEEDKEIVIDEMNSRCHEESMDQIEPKFEGAKPLGCKNCQETFDSKYDVALHMYHIHSEVLCVNCDRLFTEETEFQEHQSWCTTKEQQKYESEKVDVKDIRDQDVEEKKDQEIVINEMNSIYNAESMNKIESKFEEAKTFSCDNCQETFETKHDVALHKYKSHSEILCINCDRSFTAVTEFQEHQPWCTVKKEQKYECDICGLCFSDEEILTKHNLDCLKNQLKNDGVVFNDDHEEDNEDIVDDDQNIHKEIVDPKESENYNKVNEQLKQDSKKKDHKTFSCKICSERFSENYILVDHIQNEHAERKCRNCGAVFNAIKDFQDHTKICWNSKRANNDVDVCSYCKLCFSDQKLFIQHKLICNKSINEAKSENVNMNKYDDDNNKSLIGKESTQMKSYDNDSGIPTTALESLNKTESNKSISKLRQNGFSCDECSATFTSKYYVKKHIIEFHTERDCNNCHEVFTSQVNLLKHKLKCENRKRKEEKSEIEENPAKPSKRKRYESPNVEIEMKRRSNSPKEMNTNVKAKRNENKTEANCSISEKLPKERKVHRKSGIVDKVERNTDEMPNQKMKEPYKCDLCYKTFMTKSYIAKHIKAVHGETKCNTCGVVFNSTIEYKEHKDTCVSKFICDHCGKSFAGKKSLDTHTNESFKCKKCTLKFCGKRKFKGHTC